MTIRALLNLTPSLKKPGQERTGPAGLPEGQGWGRSWGWRREELQDPLGVG